MKTGVGSANGNEPPCAFQGVNARSQSPSPRQESEGGFLELLGARTTSTRRSQCREQVPNQGAAARLQTPAGPWAPEGSATQHWSPGWTDISFLTVQWYFCQCRNSNGKKTNQTPYLFPLELLGGFSWNKTRRTLQK